METDTNIQKMARCVLEGFCIPSLLLFPWGCQAGEKDLIPQEPDSFSQWERILAMLMLIHSPLMELGEQRMVSLYFPFFFFFQKSEVVVIILLGRGEPSLRWYSWDHLREHPLLSSCHPGCCQTHGWLWWTLSYLPDTPFTVAKRMPSLAKVLVTVTYSKPHRSF